MPIIFIVIALVALIAGAFLFTRSDEATSITENAPVVMPTNNIGSTPPPTPTPSTFTPVPEPEPAPATPPKTTPSVTSTPPPPAAAESKSYSNKIDYDTPAQVQESVTVSMTVENDVVTKVSNTYNEGTPNGYQKRFDTVYQSQVVGKKLEDISLSRVGGASLTSQAFNKAVQGFRAQS